MKDVIEYGEEDWEEEEEIPDEDDAVRQEILEAEANEIWLEEPADEEDGEPQLPSPLMGMFPFPGPLPFSKPTQDEAEEEA